MRACFCLRHGSKDISRFIFTRFSDSPRALVTGSIKMYKQYVNKDEEDGENRKQLVVDDRQTVL